MTESLNISQEQAVLADDKPTLVIAGPGSGKTTVLTRRIERLLSESKGSYSRILGLTFTNVAATNLREKILSASDEYYDRIQIGTFHSFAAKILQQHGSHIGLRPEFSIVNGLEDRRAILTRAAEKTGDAPDRVDNHAARFLPLLSKLYESYTDAASIPESPDLGEDQQLVRALFDAYLKESIESNQLDFALLVFLAERLLKTKPAICKHTRGTYRHICVDEFQDTNDAQYRLLCTLLGEDPSGLFAVADQDQVIYQWNGASPERLSDFQRRFQARIIELPTSYRCPEEIIIASDSLISHNSNRFIKPHLNSALKNSKHSHITCRRFQNMQDEFDWIASQIAALPKDKWENTVVLARARRLLEQALPRIIQTGVKAVLPLTKYQFASPPVSMLYSIFKLGNRSNDDGALRQLGASFYAMTGRSLDVRRLRAEASAQDVDVLQVFVSEAAGMASSTAFKNLATLILDELVAKKQYRRLSKAFFTWVDQLSDTDMKRAYRDDYAEERLTWETLEKEHKGLESESLPLAEFLRQIDLANKTGSYKGNVKLLTVHTAKGLEFDNVFVLGAAEGQFPSFQAVKAGANSASMEEERRSFFVAATRTRNQLYLTYSSSYFGYSAGRSRFLEEMGIADS